MYYFFQKVYKKNVDLSAFFFISNVFSELERGSTVREKVLKDGKLHSLIEFRDKIYEDLDLSKSDLTTLLCAMLIASIGLNMNSIPAIIGAMLISPLMTPILGVGFALAILDTKLLKKSFLIFKLQ